MLRFMCIIYLRFNWMLYKRIKDKLKQKPELRVKNSLCANFDKVWDSQQVPRKPCQQPNIR